MGYLILLTGSGGMVGRNLLAESLAGKYDWLAPAREELDLRDWSATLGYVRRHAPDMIIHAAGRVGGIQANIANPVAFFDENLAIGRNVVLAAREAGIRRLINIGSSCMYPRNARSPLREEDLLTGDLEPTNEGYAIAKIAVARLCQYVAREDPRCGYKTLVPCNLYGPHDKFDPASSHLVASVLEKLHRAAEEGRTSVEIWGDGTARREFLYVGDFVLAILQSIERFETLPDLMNVGVGSDLSVDEYYFEAAKVAGYRGTFEHDTSKPVGMARKLLAIDRAVAWGWTAHVTLREGLSRTLEYLREHAAKDAIRAG